jgi:hypothetical protein
VPARDADRDHLGTNLHLTKAWASRLADLIAEMEAINRDYDPEDATYIYYMQCIDDLLHSIDDPALRRTVKDSRRRYQRLSKKLDALQDTVTDLLPRTEHLHQRAKEGVKLLQRTLNRPFKSVPPPDDDDDISSSDSDSDDGGAARMHTTPAVAEAKVAVVAKTTTRFPAPKLVVPKWDDWTNVREKINQFNGLTSGCPQDTKKGYLLSVLPDHCLYRTEEGSESELLISLPIDELLAALLERFDTPMAREESGAKLASLIMNRPTLDAQMPDYPVWWHDRVVLPLIMASDEEVNNEKSGRHLLRTFTDKLKSEVNVELSRTDMSSSSYNRNTVLKIASRLWKARGNTAVAHYFGDLPAKQATVRAVVGGQRLHPCTQDNGYTPVFQFTAAPPAPAYQQVTSRATTTRYLQRPLDRQRDQLANERDFMLGKEKVDGMWNCRPGGYPPFVTARRGGGPRRCSTRCSNDSVTGSNSRESRSSNSSSSAAAEEVTAAVLQQQAAVMVLVVVTVALRVEELQ